MEETAIQERMAEQGAKKKPLKRPRHVADPAEKYATKVAVGGKNEISGSTFLGLWVTVRTALGLIDYLSETLNYSYLLTRRINQDALEVSRSQCGNSLFRDKQISTDNKCFFLHVIFLLL